MPQGPANIQHRQPQSHRLAAAERRPAHKNPAPIWFNWAELARGKLQAFKQQKLKALCSRQLPHFRKKVHRLRPFVLLVRATCAWRGVLSIAGITRTGENRSTGRETYHSVTVSTLDRTWTDMGTNASCRSDRPATDRLSHGTAVRQ